MKRIIGGLLLVAAYSLAMADEDWVITAVSEESGSVYSMKKGSGEGIKNKAGDDIYVVVGRIYDKKTKHIELEKWYVKYSDCLNKQGQLVILSIGGDFKYEYDFVFNAGSIASSNAEFICAAYEYGINERNKKGVRKR